MANINKGDPNDHDDEFEYENPADDNNDDSEVHNVGRVSVGEGASRLKNMIVLGFCLLGIIIVLSKFLFSGSVEPVDYYE